MFLYQIDPLDWTDGTVAISDFLDKEKDERSLVTNATIINLLASAFFAAATTEGCYWEGDINDLRVFGLPNCAQTMIGISWKQQNNGTTFVYSPERLPWLDEMFLPPINRIEKKIDIIRELEKDIAFAETL